MPAKGWPISLNGTIQNFEEGGRRPKAGQQARREQHKILGKEDAGQRRANKQEGNNTKLLGGTTSAEEQPTSQKETIQNFGEGGHWPKACQQARRDQYKILGKEVAS